MRLFVVVACSTVALLLTSCASGASAPAATSQPATTTSAPKPPGALTHVIVSQPVDALTFVTVYVGRHKGFYEQEGLNVEQLSTGGGGPDTQALVSGDVQFNITPGTAQADALKQGRKLIAIFNAIDKNVINMVLRKDVADRIGFTPQMPLADRLKALKGLKIAGTRPGALTYQQAEGLVKRAGLEPQKDVEIVGAGDGLALITALESGQVDAFLTAVPVPEQAVARGKAVMFINNAAGDDPTLSPFNMESVLVTQEYAAANPDIVKRFARASRAANQWISQATPDETADATLPELAATERSVLVAGAAAIKPAVNRTGILDKRGLQSMLDLTGTAVNVDDLYALFDPKFLNEP
jgi:NitT/TauT family transport system substrate-binding protein